MTPETEEALAAQAELITRLELQATALMSRISTLETQIDQGAEKAKWLEQKIARLETFITKDDDNYTTPEGMLEQGSLAETITDTVNSTFYVRTSAELVKN